VDSETDDGFNGGSAESEWTFDVTPSEFTAMSVSVECQDCGHRFRVKDELVGSQVRCSECSAPISVSGSTSRVWRSTRDESVISIPLAVGLGVGLGVIAIGLTAFMLLGRPAADDPALPAVSSTPDSAPAGVTAPPVAAIPTGTKPTPPLNLAAPAVPAQQLEGENLSALDAADLKDFARELSAKGRHREAAQCQYWAVQQEPADGLYDLACYLSLARDIDPAFYWLQRAALEVGVDTQWSTEDSDLRVLRADPRWPAILQFLQLGNAYWRTSTHTETTLVMPADVAASDPIPVLVGLHGMGHRASGFVDAGMYQEFADQHRVAFVGVSGTFPRGPRSFVWAEDAELDRQRIEAALKEVSDRLTPAPGRIVLFGFSQGGMMSAEIAVLDATRYAGAIVLSPGGGAEPNRSLFTPGRAKTQTFILNVGKGEHLGNKVMTGNYSILLKQAGADVELIVNPSQKGHSLPPNFLVDLDRWVTKILKARPE